MSAGCLGGITGGGSGVTLSPAGEVFRWQQLGPLKTKRDSTLVVVDSTLASRLSDQLSQAHFAELSLNQPGNLTCFLEVLGGPQAHQIAWVAGDEGQLPAPIREVYEALRQADKDAR